MALSKAELKKLAILKSKRGRQELGSFLVGGVRLLEEAFSSGFLPRKVFYAPSELSTRGRQIVARFTSARVNCIQGSIKDIDAISDTVNSQSMVAQFMTPETKLSKLYKPSFRRLLLCDQINDPGNLGTLIRSARAFEIDMMLITDNSVELYNPKVVRSSAGAIFGLPAAILTYSELSHLKTENKIKIAAAVAHQAGKSNDAEKSAFSKNVKNPLVLAIGSEAEGLSREVLELSDFQVSIRHSKNVESLNAAVAGSILMHEMWRQNEN